MKLTSIQILRGLILLLFILSARQNYAQQTVAREWSNMLLEAIRNDFARPTVHARNLYHHSIIAYDAWAAYDLSKDTYLLGDTLKGYICDYDGISIPLDIESARHEAISYASFSFIKTRYMNSPDYPVTYNLIYNYMLDHGYDVNNTSTDYVNGGPAELGNYLAQQVVLYGYNDGSNELGGFTNTYYMPVNPPLVMSDPGNPDIMDPNHWQPLTLDVAIDQSGNPVQSTVPFLSPEWGNVDPFSLNSNMYSDLIRDGDTYRVYFDTVHPAWLDMNDTLAWESFYKWNHSLVSIWQSHLDTADAIMWDISPASIGNNTWYPSDSTEYSAFYDLLNGGDASMGYTLNPVTGQPYTPQVVHRGDYARVLAEFWADGLDSETPPGHWFEIYHYVSSQPTFERKWQGVGPELDTLEYDVKAHLTLGGTMHDAAICAWSLKGYYDYLRPVSAIRYLADQGQSSDSLLPSYHPLGIPLQPGYIEIVDSMDALAGTSYENVGKIKLYTWRGHDYINDPETEMAGIGWILAENWWPYQRPTFVTPPFAGFVSGHSTFSRAAAGVLEYMTGSPYFPGGLGEFVAVQNEFLQFEEGPSTTVTLQWASYRDAADQCSLSRIWGGIHPPVDDIPGRMIGQEVGVVSFAKADSIFSIEHPALIAIDISDTIINTFDIGSTVTLTLGFNVPMDTSVAISLQMNPSTLDQVLSINQIVWIDSFTVLATFDVLNFEFEQFTSQIIIDNLISDNGFPFDQIDLVDHFIVDTKYPEILSLTPSNSVLNDSGVSTGYILNILMSEKCNTNLTPTIDFYGTNYINPTLSIDLPNSSWVQSWNYVGQFNAFDYDENVDSVFVTIQNIVDHYGNPLISSIDSSIMVIDTRNPLISNVTVMDTLLNISDYQSNPIFVTTVQFDEAMDTSYIPELSYYNGLNLHSSIVPNPFNAFWIDSFTYSSQTNIYSDTNNLITLDLSCIEARDSKGNFIVDSIATDVIWSDMKRPTVTVSAPNKLVVSDSLVGPSNYYVDVQFDEAMDVSIKPLVMHSAGTPISGSIQYNVPLSYYSDSFNYRAFYNVIDENIEINSIDLSVQLGKDFAQNSQNIFELNDVVELDTKNPSVNGLFANTYNLNAYGEIMEVALLFDESMFMDQPVDLVFTPQIVSPVNLPQIGYEWQNDTYLLATYELLSSGPDPSTYNVHIEGGVDKAGNLLQQFNQNDFLTIDGNVGLETIPINQVIVYPSIISNGNRLTIEGNIELNEMIVFDGAGNQMSVPFEKVGKYYFSDSIQLASGVYYLHVDGQVFRLVVI